MRQVSPALGSLPRPRRDSATAALNCLECRAEVQFPKGYFENYGPPQVIDDITTFHIRDTKAGP